ncbi:hypothetical protein BKA80DRAFT_324831, partial [Phyllosticta citrichinensis]
READRAYHLKEHSYTITPPPPERSYTSASAPQEQSYTTTSTPRKQSNITTSTPGELSSIASPAELPAVFRGTGQAATMPDMDLDTKQPLPSRQLLLEIPLEIRLHISSYLNLSDVANLRAASRQLEQEMYDLFIRLFVQTPALRRWRAIPDATLEIPWTENALKWAAFILGINGNAEHVTELHFVAYDDMGQHEERSLRYVDSHYYGHKWTDFAKMRRQLVAMESRCATLLEFIWTRTTNATTIVLDTYYTVPTIFNRMDTY